MWVKMGGLRGAGILAAAWLTAMMAVPLPSEARSFSVNPVQISLTHDQRAASLKIKNGDAAPVSIRAQALDWTQAGGKDLYSPATNLIVSPPIFTIPPGGTQIVRVGLKNREEGKAYRLMLEEIPSQKAAPGEIQVTLRLNLPVYLLPKGGGKPDMSWRAWRSADGTVTIEGVNRGTAHLQVTELVAEQEGAAAVLSQRMGVVLPGSARTWSSSANAALKPGAPFTLRVKSPAGDTQARIALELR